MKKLLFALITSACFQLSAHAQSPYNAGFEITASPGLEGIIVTNINMSVEVLQQGPGIYYQIIPLPANLNPPQTILIPLEFKVSGTVPLKASLPYGYSTIQLQNTTSVTRTFTVSRSIKTSPTTWDVDFSERVTIPPNGGTATVTMDPLTNSYSGFVFTENTVTIFKMGFIAN